MLFSHWVMSNSLWPTDYSTSGFPVLHYLLEFAQTHVPWMPSNHLILCHPFVLLLSVFPSIRVFSNESTLPMRWPKSWSFNSASFPPKKSQGWSSEWTGWISLQSKGYSRVFSNTTVRKHQFFSAQPSLWSNFHICTWLLGYHELLIAKFRLKLKKVGKTTRPFRYDLNQISYN